MKGKKRYQPSEEDRDSMNEETCIVVPKSKSGKGKGPKCTKTDGQQLGYRICKAGPKSVQNCDYKKKMEQIETKTWEENSPSPMDWYILSGISEEKCMLYTGFQIPECEDNW